MYYMSKQEITKQIFADTFKMLLKRVNYEKITVRDIIKYSGFSNKTFYYHFRDREDLVAWIFHKEVENILLNVVGMDYYHLLEKNLIKIEPRFEKVYFLILCKETNSSFSKFWGNVINYFLDNMHFYNEVLNYEGQNNFKSYLINLYHQQFKENIILLINNKDLDIKPSSSEMEMLAEYLTNAFWGTIFYWIQNGTKKLKPNFISTNLTCITQRCIDYLHSGVRPIYS